MYLGFVVSVEGLKMDPKKVKAVLEWPTPRSVAEVRSFYGLASFYRNFIKGFNSCLKYGVNRLMHTDDNM